MTLFGMPHYTHLILFYFYYLYEYIDPYCCLSLFSQMMKKKIFQFFDPIVTHPFLLAAFTTEDYT